MKTQLITALMLILLCGFNLNAQEYEYTPLVKPGLQIWTEDHGYDGENYYEFVRHALTDEEFVSDGEVYKKLYKFTGEEFDPGTAECIGGLRENEQKQVFYYNNAQNQSILLYDFSLSVGDTFDFNTGSDSNIPFIIRSIDTVTYNGWKTRRFELVTDVQFAGIWIEGIGNREGLVFGLHYNTAQNWGAVRCYLHNNELIYSDYTRGGEDCTNPLTSLNETSLEDLSITLYPNPASEEVYLSSENIILSVDIFNFLGQKIYQTEVKATEKKLSTQSLSKGVYMVGVNTDKGYIVKKLIKN